MAFSMFAFGPALALMERKEQEDALDNLHNPAGFVGAGDVNVLHRRRADSPVVSHSVGGHGNPPDSRAQGGLGEENALD
jgi:hypothetical protein